MKNILPLTLLGIASLSCGLTSASSYFSLHDGDGFKRFSVSVGALHVMPQGKAQPFRVNTAVKNGEVAQVGTVQSQTVKDNIREGFKIPPLLNAALNLPQIPAALSGSATINGLEQWDNPNTGLTADDVTTLGLMTNYYFTDNISLEIKAGIPPKVDLQGNGKIYAPFSAIARPLDGALGNLELQNDILITDLSAHGAAASARAWTPALEMQYHFGKTGVNKFRPYIGLGVIYAYFNELEINPNIEKDLINAGHMIALIKENKAGQALEVNSLGAKSSATPIVDVEASDTFAPVATLGFSYDFNERWFGVGSISYAHLKNDTTITVSDAKLGELIRSKADIEINPLLFYAGVGVRF